MRSAKASAAASADFACTYGTILSPSCARGKASAVSGSGLLNSRSGCTNSQQIAPRTAKTAAAPNEVVQPKCCATQGVNDAVIAPPICPPIFTNDEKTPELGPAISTETDQNELWEM